MKLALFLVVLILIGIASAEREYAKVNEFTVSFELNQTHDFLVDQNEGNNGSLHIRTIDGIMNITIGKFPKPVLTRSDWIQYLLGMLTGPGEQIEIDGTNGMLVVNKKDDKPEYLVNYYPDLREGKATRVVSISSNLPFYTTVDLLRTIHVAI